MEDARQLPVISQKGEVQAAGSRTSETDNAAQEGSRKAVKAHSSDGTMDLYIEGETFETVRGDFNTMLQKLMKNMSEKNADEGSITLKIAINMPDTEIPDTTEGQKGKKRQIRVPQFQHQITTGIVLKESEKGNVKPGMELYWDEETQTYKLRYIANTRQMSIFDDEFKKQKASGSSEKQDEDKTVTVNSEGMIVNEVVKEGKLIGQDPKPDSEQDGADAEDQNPDTSEGKQGEENTEGDALSAEAGETSEKEAGEEDTETGHTESDDSKQPDGRSVDSEDPEDEAMGGLFGTPVDDDSDDEEDAEYPDPDLDE